MKRILKFSKMVASGNDFVIIEARNVTTSPGHKILAKRICHRKSGAGADGMLLLEKSKKSDLRMRVFNADGSEAEMCGNGARCAALYWGRNVATSQRRRYKLIIQTKAGIIRSEVLGDNVKIKLTDPKKLKLNIPIKFKDRILHVNFINSGVPHAVIFVEGLNKIDLLTLGRYIRYHRKFAPAGTNVNLVEVQNKKSLKIRTYERGVEDETLACGTGAVAAALITSSQLSLPVRQAGAFSSQQINVHTKSGEVLRVYFNRIKNNFNDVWLEGKVKIVYKGEYHV